MKAEDDPIPLLGAAKSAGVSNWLVYAESVREHIEAATASATAPTPWMTPRARYRTLAEDHGGEVLRETAGRVPRACPASSRQEPGGGLVTAGVNEASLVHLTGALSNPSPPVKRLLAMATRPFRPVVFARTAQSNETMTVRTS